MVYPALLPLMRTPRLPVVDWTDASADLNGLVRFAERRNMVSARVPSLFNWPLSQLWTYHAEISACACLACRPYEHTKEACLSRTCSASSDMNRQWCCHLDHRSSSYQAQLSVLLRGTQESNQLHYVYLAVAKCRSLIVSNLWISPSTNNFVTQFTHLINMKINHRNYWYLSFKALWLLYVPQTLSSRNYTSCPHGVFTYYATQDKQRLFPYPALSDGFL